MIISFILQPRIERTYRRNIFDIDDLTNRYIRKASTLKTLDELIDLSVRDLCKGLSLSRGLFFMYNDTERIFKKIYDSKDEFHPDEDIERQFPSYKMVRPEPGDTPENRIYIDEESFAPIRTSVAEFFDRYGIGSVLPVYYETGFSGCSASGREITGKNLTPDEIEHLRSSESGSMTLS